MSGAPNGAGARPGEPPRSPAALFLIHDLGMGGAERAFVQIVNGLAGVRPVPVLVRYPVELAAELDARHRLHVLPGPGSTPAGGRGATTRAGTRRAPPGGPASLLWKTAGLLRLAAREEARLVSTFLHKSHAIGLCAKLLSRRDLVLVLNAHEYLSQHLVHHHEGLNRRFHRHVARCWFRRADRIVAVSQGVRADLVQRFDVPPDRVRVVPNPLPLDRIRAAAREAPRGAGGHPAPRLEDGALVLGVGRLVSLKGFDLAIRALARIRPTAETRRADTPAAGARRPASGPPGRPPRLVLLGEGPQRSALEALARDLGVADRVRFTGQVENPWAWMARADVLVLPSRTEAFPNVIGEALALGLPVVGADCSPGVREYLEDGACGLLVPPEDPAALAAAIERILADRELRERLRARGPRRVEELRPERVLARYERVLAEALEAR